MNLLKAIASNPHITTFDQNNQSAAAAPEEDYQYYNEPDSPKFGK